MRAGKKWVFNCSYWDDHFNVDAVPFVQMNCFATHWLHKLVMCLKFVTAIVVGVFLLYLQEVVVIFICSAISRFLHCDHHLILWKCCDILGTGCFSVRWKTIHKHDNCKFFFYITVRTFSTEMLPNTQNVWAVCWLVYFFVGLTYIERRRS